MNVARLIGGIFLALGLALLLLSAGLAYRTSHFRAHAAVASGSVIELVEAATDPSDEEEGSTVYKPRVQYRTATGQDLQFLSDTGSNPAAFRVGETVEVLYDPNQPESAQINTFWQLWLGTVVTGGIGLAFFITAAGVRMIGGKPTSPVASSARAA